MSAILGVCGYTTQLALADSGTGSQMAPEVMQALNAACGSPSTRCCRQPGR